jgi:glycolate oxidase iron-sulfur subunit
VNKKQSKYLEELSKCVRCGSCKAFCPTYDQEALEATGARGRLMLLRGLASGQIKPSALLNRHIFSCMLCEACGGTCPLGVDIPEAIYHGRTLLYKTDRARRNVRSLTRLSTRWPELSFNILKSGRNVLLPLLFRRGLIPFLPEFRETPLTRTYHVYSAPKKRGRVAVFSGCSVNYLFPHLGEALINVLKEIGYEIIFPKGLGCCGHPLRALGLEEDAVALARKNLGVLRNLKVEAILSLCPTCTLTLRRDYQKIIGDGLENAVDISTFLLDKLETTSPIQKTSVYHDPCHLQYGLGIKKEPREIIRKAGIEILGSEESGCCGLGGLFCFSFRNISDGILKERTAQYMDLNADTIITSCPGCMLQLSRTITDRPVIHLIELLEEAYCFRPSKEKVKKLEKAEA